MSRQKVVIRSDVLDIARFAKMIPVRKSMIKKAPNLPLPKSYAVNRTADLLHPREQKLRVKQIIEHGADTKSFVLESAENRPLAYFRAGQYLSVNLRIGNAVLTRPYSIASSPSRALRGEYVITVKRVESGFASGFILDTWEEGAEVSVSAPEGCFYYEPLRDAKTIVGIAGGSGITPFLSLANAINEQTEDAQLILLYGCRNENEILFKEELDTLAAENEKIKVVYVLSDSKKKKEGLEKGFIDRKLIKKYAPEKFSIFVCGPKAMYDFAREEIKKLGIEKKYVRFELFGAANDASELKGFPKDFAEREFNCTVKVRGEEKGKIPCRAQESVLVALERAGISVPSHCRSGECGFCRSKLLSGEVFIPEETDGRRIADAKFGYIHPCCSYPLSDIEIHV